MYDGPVFDEPTPEQIEAATIAAINSTPGPKIPLTKAQERALDAYSDMRKRAVEIWERERRS